eukprot:jgi/Chrzof1/11596/Cz06g01160.t1
MLPWPASSWARFAASVSRHHRIPRTSRRLDFVVRAKLRVRQSASKATAATKQKPATAVQLPGATQPLQTARTQQPVKRHKQAERQAVVESEKTMLVKYELSPGLCLAYRSAGVVLFDHDGDADSLRVLLVHQQAKRTKGGWSVLGGKATPGERRGQDPTATAAREVEEESHGLIPAKELQPLLHHSPVHYFLDGKMVVYLVRLTGAASLPKAYEALVAAGRLNPAAEACNRMQWMQLKLVEQNACAWMSANGSRKGEPQERIKAQLLKTGAMSVDVRRITVGLLVGQQLNRWLRQIANGEALCTQLELKLSPGVCPVPEPAAEPETDLDLDPLGSSQHKNQQQQHATGSASCVYDSVVEGDHWLAAAATGDHPGMSLTDEVEQKLQRLLLSSSNASSSTGASEQAAACHPSMHPCGHTSSSNEMAVAGEHHSCGQTMRASASNERSEESSAYTSGQRTAAGGHSTEPSAALQQSSAHNARHPDSTPTSLAVQHALVNLVAQSKALSMQIDLTMHKQQQAASMPVADTSSRMQ